MQSAKKKKTVIGASCKAQENVRLVPSEIGVKRAKYVRLVSTYT